MSSITWSKFFWSDWRSDPALRLCGLAARGLWIDMLSFMAEADGYLLIGGKAPSPETLARLLGATVAELQEALRELEEHAVFSRTGRGVIYCRRIVKAAKKAATARENGKKSSGPTNGNDKGSSDWDTNGPGRLHKPEPEAIDAIPSEQHLGARPSETWPEGGIEAWVKLLSAVSGGRLDPEKEPGLTLTRSLVVRWQQRGFSFGQDVIPAVQALCKRKTRAVTTWAYFDDAVQEANRLRLAPSSPRFAATGDPHDRKLARKNDEFARDFAVTQQMARDRGEC